MQRACPLLEERSASGKQMGMKTVYPNLSLARLSALQDDVALARRQDRETVMATSPLKATWTLHVSPQHLQEPEHRALQGRRTIPGNPLALASSSTWHLSALDAALTSMKRLARFQMGQRLFPQRWRTFDAQHPQAKNDCSVLHPPANYFTGNTSFPLPQ